MTRLYLMIMAALLAACTTQQPETTTEPAAAAELYVKKSPPRQLEHARGEGFIRVVDPIQTLRKRQVTVPAGDHSVHSLLATAFPGISVRQGDAGVSLGRTLSLDALPGKEQEGFGGRAGDLVDLLENRTGYAVEAWGGAVTVYSFREASWDVAPLMDGADALAWERLIQSSENILGIDEGGAIAFADDSVGPLSVTDVIGAGNELAPGLRQPYVDGVQEMNRLAAAGPALAMRSLHRMIDKAVEDSLKNINIDIDAYEVTLRGITAEELEAKVSQITSSAPENAPEALREYLQSFGEVSIERHPNITLRNGSSAAFALDAMDEDAGTVKFDLTARVVTDGEIIISLQHDMVNMATGTSSLVSTEVVARNGAPIHVGGLVGSVNDRSLHGVPIRDEKTRDILNLAVQGVDSSLMRREIVVVLTPRLVEPKFL